MAKGIHTEEAFEASIVAHLVEHGGYEEGRHEDYDRERAFMPGVALAFVKATQAERWARLEQLYPGRLEGMFLDGLERVLDTQGTLHVLRHGFKFYGQKLRLAFFEPGHQLNPDVWALFAQNRLTVIRQLRYETGSERALDLGLFINGLPVVTAELKNAMTGQTVQNAIRQYQGDRDPNAPLFRWRNGNPRSLVHFAVDTDQAFMTTRLQGPGTHFLPFNKGDAGGAGNPSVQDRHRTHYLWEDVWTRRCLLELVARFIHHQKTTRLDTATGQEITEHRIIFPRYHQLDCVRRLLASSRALGAGTNYLIQHSAGSGKSNSIAWLAHRLSSLHDAQDQKVYDSVIVLTDRVILDRQLQETIAQFEHRAGVVQKIDEDSAQLAQALAQNVPIIISTIHKFGFIHDKIEALPDRRYAIIVDEAHSSQSGEMAVSVKEMLAGSHIAQRLGEELEDDATPGDQLALRAALVRGPQPNMSFFAFTATPKYKTLEMFGHRDADGRPMPFHLYSMRQAIEEGFILDVLQGYTTYERFFQLAKTVSDDPELDKRQAASALARFVNLHPTNVAQKTEVIIEHFRSCVMHQLGGRAKAMVVTSSRLMAVRYKLAFDEYIERKGYARDIRTLVAFSGEVKDELLPDEVFTEPKMNDGISEKQLRDEFAKDEYKLLIVANKYQTGFDEPLLCAMYVDKRLSGIQAVQTLSRLNRTTPGKSRTFVLDFVNDREEIRASFQDFYEVTTVDAPMDPQRLYELLHELDSAYVWQAQELDAFAEIFFKPKEAQRPSDHKRLNALVDPAVDRFKHLGEDEDEKAREAAQEAFRGKLAAFLSLYSFVSQTVPFGDADLEKAWAFGKVLLSKLPQRERDKPWTPGDDVELAAFKLQVQQVGAIELKRGEGGEVSGPRETGTAGFDTPHEHLSTIIHQLNDRFGLGFPDSVETMIDGVTNELVTDENIQLAARVNDRGNFNHVFRPALRDALIEQHEQNGDFINTVMGNQEILDALSDILLEQVYERLNKQTG